MTAISLSNQDLSLLAEQSRQRLDWPLVLAQITGQCFTPYGLASWETAAFVPGGQPAVTRHCEQVAQLQQHLNRHGLPPDLPPNISDSRPALNRVGKQGSLTWAELTGLRNTLTVLSLWWRHFQKDPDTKRLLLEGWQPVPQALLDRLTQTVSETGELLTSASTSLGKLLHQQQSMKRAADAQLQSLLKDPELATCLQSTQATIRNGQLVLAVKAVHKHSFPGQLMAGSASGSTVFMSPHALQGLNQRLQAAEAEIEAEIQRILVELSRVTREQLEALNQLLEQFAYVDRLLAGALWAKRQSATIPEILPEHLPAQLRLKQCRHPLIENVVANDITLGVGDRSLIITGPNTGGKTVLLKTLGLMVLLLQAGLPLPVAEGSALSLFNAVYADVGDEQSIQQNLSTFSAHLVKLRALTQETVDLNHSLVLLDEIAAGTDPTEGAALAQAVLAKIQEAGALAVVTTHLGSLKVFAHETPGFQNASVAFDPETLAPTYRLMQGVPGTSHALSIAGRLGLNPSLLADANRWMTDGERDTAGLLEDLAAKQASIQEALHQAESYKLAAQEEFEKLALQRQTLEQERKQLLHQLKTNIRSQTTELQTQIKQIRKRLYREMIPLQTDTQTPVNRYKVGKLADQLKQLENRSVNIFHKADRPLATPVKLSEPARIAVGQTMFSQKLNMNVTVASVNGTKAQVEAGLIKATVPIADLEVSHKQHAMSQRSSSRRQSDEVRFQSSGQRPEASLDQLTCDVRGQSMDDALAQISLFLDQALLAGYDQVSIIHGLGTGVLKQTVRAYLRRCEFVKTFGPAPAVDGGDGKTDIRLG